MSLIFVGSKRAANDEIPVKGRAKKRKSSRQANIVVIVGSEAKEFVENEDLLRRRSAFFRGACALPGRWTEDPGKIVSLPDQSPVAFKLYLEFVRSENTDLFSMAKEEAKGDISQALDSVTAATGASTWQQIRVDKAVQWTKAARLLLDLWRLADYLGDTACKNAVVRALRKKDDAFTDFADMANMSQRHTESHSLVKGMLGETISNIDGMFEVGQVGSGVQKWAVDWLIPRLSQAVLDLIGHKLGTTCLLEILRRIVGRAQWDELRALDSEHLNDSSYDESENLTS